ncbi:MAG: DUF971 domain-containing protein [Aureliella sp.]
MTITPAAIQRLDPSVDSDLQGPAIEIEWSDGSQRTYSVASLRAVCPCATCREKKRAKEDKPQVLPVLKIEETRPVDIKSMGLVGNYGYNIAFTDGHDSGIFTFEFLHGLADQGS